LSFERRCRNAPFFHYAAFSPLIQQDTSGDYKTLEPWANLWTHYISKVFLKAYLEQFQGNSVLTRKKEQLPQLLKVYLLEKAVYEIGYEIKSPTRLAADPV